MGERDERPRREGLIFTNKILIYFLQLSYNVIVNVESHCSTIASFLTLLSLYKFRWLF